MQLLVATRNSGKLKEIRRLLAEIEIDVLGLDEVPGMPEIVEDGATFEENARKKGEEIARRTGRLTLADDSGLVVAALNGAPGVLSARYAGEGASDAANNQRLLTALGTVPAERRQAAFVCVMALCWPEGECRIFEGRVEGEILSHPRGDGGFGYDPLFLLPKEGLTMAELPIDRKNRLSHRGQALRQAVTFLQQT